MERSSQRSLSESQVELFTFLQRVDQIFPVAATRLKTISSETKIKLGSLFVSHILVVFWRNQSFIPNDFTDSSLDAPARWARDLLASILEILDCSADEKIALVQYLEISLPPNAAASPEGHATDAIITDLSTVDGFVGEDRNLFIKFLESYPCVAPIVLVVLLRDCVVHLILQSSSVNVTYNSRTREVLFSMALSFSLDADAVRVWEKSIGAILHGSSQVSSSKLSGQERQGMSRRLKIGIGAVGGAVLLGVTGGLAFPMLATLASGVGTAFTGLGLGVVGTVFATTSMVLGSVSVASAVALFGITGGSLVSYKLSNRFGSLNVKDFKFKEIGTRDSNTPALDDALEVVICVSGYLRSSKDCIEPWKILENTLVSHPLALQWERENLERLGNVFVKLLSAELATALTNAYLQMTLGAVASTVVLPISVLSAMSDLDNILIVCEDRAQQAGQALSEVIRNPDLGARPYTLIAYSVGSTAVFACLQALADAEQFFSVQDVILIGSTIPCTFLYEDQRTPWQKARSVVSGRIINVFSKKDMLLQVLCRYLQWTIQVSGVMEVFESGIENYDVSDLIASHSDYPSKIPQILERIGYIK